MPDITVARASEPWAPDTAVGRNRSSALNLVHQLLDLSDVTTQHKTEQLKIGLWKWTIAEGVGPHPKFNTRYFSAGVMAQAGPASINHEHVWTMKDHVTTLTSRSWTKDELDEYLLAYGVACIVTVAEHALLSGSKLNGWARYAEQGIAVVDRSTGAVVDLAAPREQPDAPPSTAGLPTAASFDVRQLIAERTGPELADRLERLLRTARMASAAPAVSLRRDGTVSAYFRIHDGQIEEPTPAVAYVHWSGKVDFRLDRSNLPPALADNPAVRVLRQPHYAVSVKVADDATLALAEDLLVLSLQSLREAVPQVG